MKTNNSLPKFHLLVIVAVAAVSGLLAWGIPQYSHAKETNRAHHKLVKPLPPSAPVAPLTIPPAPPLPPATKMTVRFYADTTGNKAATDSIVSHSKAKFKIVMEDDKGNKKEYNSVQELPDSEKREFLKENPAFGDFDFKFRDSLKFAHFKDFKMDPKFRKEMLAMKTDAEKMRRQFENDPKWKEQALKMKLDAEKMSKQFNSPEWKKQVEDMKLQAEKMSEEYKNSPDFQKQIEDMKIQAQKMSEKFNSPEWKKQVEDMKLQAEKISKQVNSAAWEAQVKEMKKQAERINKQFNLPEWKKQMEDMQETIKKEVDENLQKANLDSVKTAN